jgi:hypothetical protein
MQSPHVRLALDPRPQIATRVGDEGGKLKMGIDRLQRLNGAARC